MAGPTLDPLFISLDGEFLPFEVALIGTDGEFSFVVPDNDMITDYPERTAALLIEQFEPSEDLQSFVKALSSPANEIEKVLFDLKHQRNITFGDGVQLDLIGELIGEPRNGKDDDDYRQALFLRPNINKSYGEGEILISVLKQLTKATEVLLLESEPKTVSLFYKSTSSVPNNLQESLEAVADAGVKINISYVDDGDVFGFAPEGGLPQQPGVIGFGEVDFPDEGGKFAEVI
jgi:hypothetical protein